MKFFLVKEQHVVFTDIPDKTKPSPIYHTERKVSVPADLHLDDNNSDEECHSFRQLKSIIKKGPSDGHARKCLPSAEREKQPVTLKKQMESNNLLVEIGMYNSRTDRNFVRVTDDANGNILENIRAVMETYKLVYKIGFKLEKYKFTCNGTESSPEVNASGIDDWDQISSNKVGSEGTELLLSHQVFSVYWSRPDIYKNHNAVISIYCDINPSHPLPIFGVASTTLVCEINQRILTKEIMSDAIIRTKDNAEIKCHSSFLAVHSDVLEKAFGGSFEESKSKLIEMPDTSSTSVKAFLAFLYYADLEKATEKAATAVEVLQASHKYNVVELEEQMKAVILFKPDEWFDVEAALKLFLFSRLLEQEDRLKLRAVEVIKANFASFESSLLYDELFEKNPKVAKELFKVVCMLK